MLFLEDGAHFFQFNQKLLLWSVRVCCYRQLLIGEKVLPSMMSPGSRSHYYRRHHGHYGRFVRRHGAVKRNIVESASSYFMIDEGWRTSLWGELIWVVR